MCLLPFSTGTGAGSFVVTFAFPFLVLLAVFIFGNLISRKERINYPDDLKLTLLCALIHTFSILITSLMNESLIQSFARSIFSLIGYLILLYITSNASISKDAKLAYNKISWVLILSGTVMAIYFIVNFLLAIQQNSLDKVLLERENGGLMSLPWGASNTIAGCLMMPFFLALERAFNMQPFGKKQKSPLMFGFMLIIIIAILITQSRNVIVTLAMGTIFIGGLTKNIKPTLIFLTILGIVFVLLLSLLGQDLETIFAARLGDRAQDVGGFNGRTTLWEVSLAYFALHPFQPLGYFGMLGELGHTAHNVFLTTLLEQGVLGLIAYLLFLINNFWYCVKKMNSKSLSFMARKRMTLYLIAMLCILLQLQFEDSNLTAQNIIFQWIFLALMYLSSYCDTPEDADDNRANALLADASMRNRARSSY
ncbi:lipid A core-O-antigen ligase-like enyme [Chamaesiphon minutus PCC 6605]|uniref:Lipid A core-O-antigen ligase-like enyme n=2 Tax=Chamaesiphon TaxID=217161 RepID=K9UHH1_CHAP6|nr:lipid A core-O-antigen ligase-like enyme [Chamaesiphon minutus PCC 6605]